MISTLKRVHRRNLKGFSAGPDDDDDDDDDGERFGGEGCLLVLVGPLPAAFTCSCALMGAAAGLLSVTVVVAADPIGGAVCLLVMNVKGDSATFDVADLLLFWRVSANLLRPVVFAVPLLPPPPSRFIADEEEEDNDDCA